MHRIDTNENSNYPRYSLLSIGVLLVSLLVLTSQAYPAAASDGPTITEIGFTDAGNTGVNSDIWAHGDFAYTGTWGTGGPFCPADSRDPRVGVKVIDISDPTSPFVDNVLPLPINTRANDIKVAEIETDFFEGDLLVHSLERCDMELIPAGANGFAVYDVTDATSPVLLSSFDSGFFRTHNVFLFQQDDRAFVMIANEFANFARADGLPEGDGTAADFRIVEVTDPTSPVQVSEFNIFLDAPELVPDFSPVRGDPTVFLHDVWVNEDATMALLPHWDAGLIVMDISVPETPTVIGATTYWPAEEGNTHAAVFADDDNLAIVGDEIFACPWGFMRIFDISDPTSPVQISTFEIPEVRVCPPAPAGFFTAHNPFVADDDDDLVFISWYGAGVLVIDIDDPTKPTLVAQFTHEGRGVGDFAIPGISQGVTSIWGVVMHPEEDLLIASDIDAGVFILEFER